MHEFAYYTIFIITKGYNINRVKLFLGGRTLLEGHLKLHNLLSFLAMFLFQVLSKILVSLTIIFKQLVTDTIKLASELVSPRSDRAFISKSMVVRSNDLHFAINIIDTFLYMRFSFVSGLLD